MTVNKATAISVKRDFFQSYGTVESCLFNILVPPSFDERKKAETIIIFILIIHLHLKIQVFKSLIFSKLVYVATMNAAPKTITDQLQVIHKDFIWRGNKVKIKHSTLIGEYADVGLRGLDIPSSLTSVKISWIPRLFDNNFHPWKTLAKRILHKVGGLYIFHFDLKLSEQSLYDVKRLPSFCKDLVLLWEKYSNLLVQREVNKTTVFSQAIFNNKNLLIKGESIWHKLLYSQGMRIIGDLYDNEGSIKTWSVLSAEYLHFR